MANMRKQNVRTGTGKAWGMLARRAGAGGTGCNCRKSSEQQFCVTVHTGRGASARLTCNGARAYATRCVSSPVSALRSWED